MVQLPSEDSDQPFSAVTFPQFAVGFIVIAVALVLIGCLLAQLNAVSPASNPHSISSATLSPQVQVADPRPDPSQTVGTASEPRNFNLGQEFRILFSTPVTLPAVIAVLVLGATAGRKRRD